MKRNVVVGELIFDQFMWLWRSQPQEFEIYKEPERGRELIIAGKKFLVAYIEPDNTILVMPYGCYQKGHVNSNREPIF